jgi:hypothetical protein
MHTPTDRLYLEELKALTRGRFAWLGASVILFAVGVLATAGTQDAWLDGYGIVAYGIVPLAFIPISAVAIASPRANRFVESIFTAPVDRGWWLMAKLLVLLTLAAAYYAALAPMALVYIHHVGVPPLLDRFFLWTPALLLISVAVGMLIGVMFIGRSIAAPAATGMGVLLAYAGLIPLQELLVAQGNGATRTGHLTLLSPAVLVKNALGFTLVAANVPDGTSRTWVCLIILIAGALAVAFWTFLHAQGVETWEATRRQRWAITIAIGIIVLAPVYGADVNYERQAPRPNAAPVLRGVFGAPVSLALVDPGASAPARCCSALLNRNEWPIPVDQSTAKDLLVMLPVDVSHRIHDVRVSVAGQAGLEFVTTSGEAAYDSGRLERRDYPPDTGPMSADGRHISSGWVVRVGVTLRPTAAWDVGGMRYPLNVATTYHVDDEPQPRSFATRGAIEARIAPAIYEMGMASALLPLLCCVAGIRRWRQTR